jgi:hypothetical protein
MTLGADAEFAEREDILALGQTPLTARGDDRRIGRPGW